MKPATPIAIGLLFLLAGCAGIGVETMGNLRSPNDHVGAPWLVGEPRYPKAELAQGVNGYVDIEGRVDWRGELQDVKLTPDRAESGAFATAVHDALPMWLFYTPLDESCQPSGERIKLRAWFEVENGKPRFALSPISPQFSGKNQPHPVRTREAIYPHAVTNYRWHEGAVVFAKATIDPAGNVVDADVTAYPRGLPWLMMPFEDQARIALLDFKFPPASAAGSRHYCTDIVFKAQVD
jgi:hypothetical protein